VIGGRGASISSAAAPAINTAPRPPGAGERGRLVSVAAAAEDDFGAARTRRS